MTEWYFFGGLAVGALVLAGRMLFGTKQQQAAADAAGLGVVSDLTHIPVALQHTALWSMSEGGFESRIVHGIVTRHAEDVEVTAFDLETHRERRGEWAWLPVEPPFRIAGTVSVVACKVDRAFPHYVLKRVGRGDEMVDDTAVERGTSIAKLVRDGLGLSRHHPAELPPTLGATPLDVGIPDPWRAYGRDATPLLALLGQGFATTLTRADRRDLVIELVDGLVLVYPAARDVVGADAFADLTTTALSVVEGLLAASTPLTPRGVDVRRPEDQR
ncbi:MAG: hypothetical protein M3680_28370 [Myxococcota bacterium]|nr:hypothetical protein [Myxococcota bacterium]